MECKPSEYFRRHGHASFQEDPVGIQAREWLGVNSIMWGNDYPHLEGTWPYSGAVTSKLMEGLPHDEKAKILGPERRAPVQHRGAGQVRG